MTTTKYIGPVYLWGTNTYVPYKGTRKLLETEDRKKEREKLNKQIR